MTQGHEELYTWTEQEHKELQARLRTLETLVAKLLVHQHQQPSGHGTTPEPYRSRTSRPIGLGSEKL